MKARATTEGIEMEEYGENDSSNEDVDSEENIDEAQVTFTLPKQRNKVS